MRAARVGWARGPPVELGKRARHRGSRARCDPPGESVEQLVECVFDRYIVGDVLRRVLEHGFGRAPADLEEDVLLVREVEVEGSLRDPGRLRDLLDGGLVDAGVEAALGPQRECGVDQRPSCAA